MQLSGLKSAPYFEERRESIDPGSRSRQAALGMYLPSVCAKMTERVQDCKCTFPHMDCIIM